MHPYSTLASYSYDVNLTEHIAPFSLENDNTRAYNDAKTSVDLSDLSQQLL